MLSTDEALLAEFPPVDAAAWEAAIARDLRGAPLEKLIVHAAEGFDLRPCYREEDLAGMDWIEAASGDFPYLRGTRNEGNWRIREAIDAVDPAAASRAALAAVAAGADEVAFTGIALDDASVLSLFAANLHGVPLHFAAADERLLRLLLQFLSAGGEGVAFSAGFAPLGNPDFAASILASAPPGFVPFSLTAPGRHAVEEVGHALAAGIEFLDAMTSRHIDAGRAAAAVEFEFAIGSNYFFAIATLRAFRMLWARALGCFGVSKQSARARIAAHTTLQPAAGSAGHLNILRATTQAMAAALGGADAITVTPCDASEDSRRLARNTQLLLRHEAMFARVADPGGGSYCIETLTRLIAEGAWKHMQRIEAEQAAPLHSGEQERNH